MIIVTIVTTVILIRMLVEDSLFLLAFKKPFKLELYEYLMKKRLIFFVVVLAILVTSGFIIFENLNNNSGNESCSVNSDCVASSCCHPKDCVDKNSAPSCKGIACTMSCEVGTLDCGQGSCECKNNKCIAVIK